ncbi:MAG: D-alanyl-D-alanine carboxypeptidase family protein [Clostridia bacterium]|nr:D-alanyl-D-alanine carboxypeptidase family protein [Clostridia bacterium]
MKICRTVFALLLVLFLTACAGEPELPVQDTGVLSAAPPAGNEPLPQPDISLETTAAPETKPPVTEPPATEPPVTAPPVTAPPVTEPPVTEPPVTAAPVTEPPVTASGEHTIEVIDGVTYIDGVLIVNKTYSLPADYPQKSLTPEALNAYWTMKQVAAAEGLTIKSISDYRSWYDQRYIYNGYVARDGQEAADRYSARPGHSEHQSGLAIDINSTAFDFDQTPEGIWLATHCVEYGYVIRYPKGKEEITGYLYEPWHIRYVGKELAQKLYLGDGQFITLEEYFGITSAYAE